MKKFFLYSLLFSLCACATQRMKISSSSIDLEGRKPNHNTWHHFFLYGIGKKEVENTNKVCSGKGGVAVVEVKQNLGQVLLSGITQGIYTPRNYSVYCEKE